MDRHIARNEGIGTLSVKSWHRIDADVTEGFRAGKGIIAVGLSLIDGRPGDACQLPEISWDFRHPCGESPQHGIRCRARVGRLQMTEAFLRVLDNTDIASRGDGDAARVRHLFDEEHIGAGIMRFDGGDGAGITIAHYDHIGRCVPTFLRFGTCPRVPAHSCIKPQVLAQPAAAGCEPIMVKRGSTMSLNRREAGTLPSLCWSAMAAASPSMSTSQSK